MLLCHIQKKSVLLSSGLTMSHFSLYFLDVIVLIFSLMERGTSARRHGRGRAASISAHDELVQIYFILFCKWLFSLQVICSGSLSWKCGNCWGWMLVKEKNTVGWYIFRGILWQSLFTKFPNWFPMLLLLWLPIMIFRQRNIPTAYLPIYALLSALAYK